MIHINQVKQFIADNNVNTVLIVIADYCRAQATLTSCADDLSETDAWTCQARSIEFAAQQADRRGL